MIEEEACPYCDGVVQPRDSFCPSCGEPLGAPGEYEEDLPDPIDSQDDLKDFDEWADEEDRSEEDEDDEFIVEADTGDGQARDDIYRQRSRDERSSELKLLAAVVGGAIVILGILGLTLGWWGGGADDDTAGDADAAGRGAIAVNPEDASSSAPPPPDPVVGDLQQLGGLSVAFSDNLGLHLRSADGSVSLDVPNAARVTDLNGGAVAIGSDSLFYVDGATIRRQVVSTGENTKIGEGDWVATVPTEPGSLWIVDRREDSEVGATNVLLKTDLGGEIIDEVELPGDANLDGATSAGVIVFDPASGTKSVIGPDDFTADLVPATAIVGAVVSPDNEWLVRAIPGEIVARPIDGTEADEFTIIEVPSQPAVPVEFVVDPTPS